jgi:adenylate kinase family enzyme
LVGANYQLPLTNYRLTEPVLQRIVVIGTSGSGKTTLAGQLAGKLGLVHIELDALHWRPDWQMAPLPEFRASAAEAVSQERWALDGNYSKVRDIVWARADTVVWLDYSLPRIMWQLLRRTLSRSFKREELWAGNRESVRTSFFSRDSILLWALTTYRRRRRNYPQLLALPEHSHLHVVHLRSPRETADWLASL